MNLKLAWESTTSAKIGHAMFDGGRRTLCLQIAVLNAGDRFDLTQISCEGCMQAIESLRNNDLLVVDGLAHCEAMNRRGRPCSRAPVFGKSYCPSHAHLEVRETAA